MSEPARLHPLVAEASALVAGCQTRLEYWEVLAASYPDEVPEDLIERIEMAGSDLAHRSAMLARLRSKLAEAQSSQ